MVHRFALLPTSNPANLRGIMSEGMILSAEDADGKLVLVRPGASVTNGVEDKIIPKSPLKGLLRKHQSELFRLMLSYFKE